MDPSTVPKNPARYIRAALAAVAFLLVSCAQPGEKPGSAGVAERLRALARERPMVVAHRGSSHEYPENTLPAFEAAVRERTDLVELDFHATSDGVLVCLHDEDLDRTTDAEQVLGRKKVKVAETPLSDISRLDAGRWKDSRFAGTPLPTLSGALETIGKRTLVMVERKQGSPSSLLEVLRKLDLVDEVLVQSFDWDWLEEIHRLEPRLALAALGKDPLTPELLERLGRTGACMAHWDARKLRLEDVGVLKDRGYLVAVYTIDEDIGFIGAAAAGADAITTNRPARLVELIRDGRMGR